MGKDTKQTNKWTNVVIPGLSIVIVVVILNIFIYNLELKFYKNIYDNEVAETSSLVKRRFQSALIAVESLRAFFVSSQEVTHEEFDIFGEVLTKNITAGPIVMPIISEWVDTNNIVRYVYPVNKNSGEIVGLDLNKYPNRLVPLIKAKETRLTTVTEPIMLVEGYPGLLLYSPIFKGDDYLGSALVVIRIQNLLAPVQGGSPIYNKNIYIQTGNFIMPFDDDMIFNNNGERVVNPLGDLIKDPISNKYLSSIKGVTSQDIVFADKTWQLKLSPVYIEEVNKRMGIYIGVSVLFASTIILFLWFLERRRIQLLKITARTEALILGIGEGLVACDKNGLITFANKKAEELSGYNRKKATGISYYDVWRLVDGKNIDVPQKERPFYRALTKKEIVNISTGDHLYVVKKDGARFPLASTIAPIIVNGVVDGAIAVFRDITKEAEVDRMKTEFLSLVSHQLLTPSTSIKWTTELLLGGKYGALDEKQKENIRNIYATNEGMIHLVTNLLNVSRIESGRIVIDPKPTNLSDLVNETAQELKNRIEEKEQIFNVTFEKTLQPINIDANLIKQVYKNLLTNAIKYTPPKGTISVEIRKEKDSIVSKISDNGYGIPEKDKARVFEKFYRGENILEIEKDGNGLGLYLIKQIVDVSGGKIWFESAINKGTTFWFSLPITGSQKKEGEVTIT